MLLVKYEKILKFQNHQLELTPLKNSVEFILDKKKKNGKCNYFGYYRINLTKNQTFILSI